MSTRYQTINTTLRTALNGLAVTAKGVAVPKYYQGDVKPATGPFLYTWLLTPEPVAHELGYQAREWIAGVYQIDVYTPADATWACQDLVIADQLSTFFYRGRRLGDIRIKGMTKGTSTTDGGYFKTVCNVLFDVLCVAG